MVKNIIQVTIPEYGEEIAEVLVEVPIYTEGTMWPFNDAQPFIQLALQQVSEYYEEDAEYVKFLKGAAQCKFLSSDSLPTGHMAAGELSVKEA
jgi:hypothetical protein